MKTVVGKVIVVVVLTLPLAFLAAADKPHMANSKAKGASKNNRWVTRRDPTDANTSNGSVAMIVDLDEFPANTGRVGGTLKFWTTTGTTYDVLHTYDLNPVPVTHVGEDNYKREYCRWVNATSSANPMEPAITVYASLFKAKGHGQADSNRRLIIRFKYPPGVAALKAMAPASGDCCDTEPDDDVLEEETNPPDPPDGP